MKKLFVFFAAIAVLAACNKDDDFGSGGNLQPVAFTVALKYDTEAFGGQAAANVAVTLTNTNTGDVYNLASGTDGNALFAAILPGTYNITATQTLTSSQFNTIFGYAPETDEVIFNGAQQQVIVNANVTATQIELNAARIGDLVIKQIYYAGSSTTQGASFRDQFIEIYNNSNEVIYADGLYIGQLYGRTTTTAAAFAQASGQFDWSQSVGMTSGASANTNYVYADYVIRIPGNGTQYPIEPGESIVIAQSAVNHKSPLVTNEGEPITINNPALTIDLSTANFETYLGTWRESIGETVYLYDLQNPAVPDMEISYWGKAPTYSGNKDLLMDNPGRDSFVIFRTEDLATYQDFPDPSVSSVTSSTKYFLQIPNSVIIDGVDLQHFNPSSQRPKMLPSSIDASFIGCDASFNSQSVIRRTKTTVNGRRILEDTNNSATDFAKMPMATPNGFID